MNRGTEDVDLKNQVKVLSEKNTPELLKEIEERFADDQKGIMDAKRCHNLTFDRCIECDHGLDEEEYIYKGKTYCDGCYKAVKKAAG